MKASQASFLSHFSWPWFMALHVDNKAASLTEETPCQPTWLDQEAWAALKHLYLPPKMSHPGLHVSRPPKPLPQDNSVCPSFWPYLWTRLRLGSHLTLMWLPAVCPRLPFQVRFPPEFGPEIDQKPHRAPVRIRNRSRSGYMWTGSIESRSKLPAIANWMWGICIQFAIV